MSGLKRPNEKHLMLFSGRAHPGLANEVAELMKVELVPTRAITYANSEIYVRFDESVRGCDAFVIQSHAAPVNEWTMEQLIMVDALKRASAKRITVVAPSIPMLVRTRSIGGASRSPRALSRTCSTPPGLTGSCRSIYTRHRSKASSMDQLIIYGHCRCCLTIWPPSTTPPR